MQSKSNAISAADYFNRVSRSNPVYASDETIAYLDDSSGTKQLFVHNLNSGENKRITDFTEGILSLTASASTKTIMFGVDQKGDERQQLYTVDGSGDTPTRITHDDGAFFEPGGISNDGSRVIYRTNSRDETIFDVVVSNIDGSGSKIWLENGGQVLPQGLAEEGAFVIQSKGNPADDLLLIRENGDVTNLTADHDIHRVYAASFHPGTTRAWVISELGREFAALFSLDLSTGAFTPFYEAEWGVEIVSVSPNGEHLAVSVNENGYSRPVIISTSDATDVRTVSCPEGVIDGFSWSPDSQKFVVGISTAQNPSQIFMSNLNGESEVLIRADGSESGPTVAEELVHIPTWDGRKIPAFLYLPEGPGPHAALVEIHGGPESQRRPEYGSTGASIQYLVSRGIAVLALNIRGSIGYGRAYRHLDDLDKRLDALKDVEQAATWLGNRDDISEDRIGVFGISYGGFMTLSALTRLPHLWAAGAEMVGMAHLETFLERTGPWRRPNREAEYGSLEHDREMLRAVSPLPLVDRIEAPLLVLHGRNDARVPLHESEQMVEAVSKRGIDVDLVIYDDEGHIFTKRNNLIHAYTRVGDFLAEHLRVQG